MEVVINEYLEVIELGLASSTSRFDALSVTLEK